MYKSTTLLGIATIALAIAFNIPFSILGTIFDYPDILRQPSAEVLNRFHTGGPALVMTWYGFMLCAIFLVPFAIWLSKGILALRNRPVLSKLAMFSGVLAGILQAIGLSRWVFVVPMLASHHADPATSPDIRAMTELVFETLNLWGGVALGEHLGQIMTCLFVAPIAWAQFQTRSKLQRSTSLIGLLAVIGITTGLGEGIAIGLHIDGSAFSPATVLGYIGFSLWMVLTGVTLIVSARPASDQPAAG